MDEFVKPARVKIGGLWKNETKGGKSYLSGDLSFGSAIEIWPNVKREGKKDPDYQIFIVEKIKKEPKLTEVEMPFKDIPF